MGNLHEALLAAQMAGNNSSGGDPGGESFAVWRPTVSADGTISWNRSSSTTKPADQNIKGPQGEPGQDGASPIITVEDIEGGHRVTIVDAAHPQGQAFNVMNGKDGGGLQVQEYTNFSEVFSEFTPQEGSMVDVVKTKLADGIYQINLHVRLKHTSSKPLAFNAAGYVAIATLADKFKPKGITPISAYLPQAVISGANVPMVANSNVGASGLIVVRCAGSKAAAGEFQGEVSLAGTWITSNSAF